MTDSNDKNYSEEIDGGKVLDDLLKRLTFLRDSGVDYLPISGVLDTPIHQAKIASKKKVIEDIVEAECTRCDLSEDRTLVLKGEGAKNAKVMIVGDSPSAGDDREGKVFTGAEGELLNKIIKAAGLGREDVFLCFAVRCHGTGEVTEEHKEKCMVHLINDFLRVKPKAILAFGTIAEEGVRVLDSKNTFVVPGLKETVEDPTLKIETWDKIQKLMQTL